MQNCRLVAEGAAADMKGLQKREIKRCRRKERIMVPRMCSRFILALIAHSLLLPVHAGVVASAPAERVKADHPAALVDKGTDNLTRAALAMMRHYVRAVHFCQGRFNSWQKVINGRTRVPVFSLP
jgi:hypothetical protein